MLRGITASGSLARSSIDQLGEFGKVLGGKERFGKFMLDSMPANGIARPLVAGSANEDSMFSE